MAITGAGTIPTFRVQYEGSDIVDYHNPRTAVPHDKIVRALLPPVVGQCSIARERSRASADCPCMCGQIVGKIAQGYGVHAPTLADAMRALMEETDCADEKCVLERARKAKIISIEEAGIEEQLAFKQRGPTDVALFNDAIIHAQLYAWMYQFPQFWAYNFNMLDYATSSMRDGKVLRKPDTLATINWCDLYEGRVPAPVGMRSGESARAPARAMLNAKRARGIRCSGCVINSDVYDGSGKHWMALFVDARDDGAAPAWTVEFFNSAAVRPENEWLAWMVKTRRELQSCNPRARIEIVPVCKIWHQHSATECGPYSVFYIWARLNRVPAQYFIDNVVPDQIMFEFRQHLFDRDGDGRPFDFQEYKKSVRVRWDVEDLQSGEKRHV